MTARLILNGPKDDPPSGLCEWDPNRSCPATEHPGGPGFFWRHGCPNKATLVVGAKGQWHLCEECAALPRFRRFRFRKKLRGAT